MATAAVTAAILFTIKQNRSRRDEEATRKHLAKSGGVPKRGGKGNVDKIFWERI